MDKLFIRQLCVPTDIGVYPQEQQQAQQIVLDLEISTDVAKAAKDDSIDDALDYARLRQGLIVAVQQTRFKLIESLAEYLAAYVLENFPIDSLRLSVTKTPKDMPDTAAVGVIIERSVEPLDRV